MANSKRAFTLIELLVVIAIIALLLAVLIPSLNMAKEVARRVICMTQLKGFGTALQMYSKDYNEKALFNSGSRGEEKDDGIDSGYQPWHSYVIGYEINGDPDLLKAFNHGKLYDLQYLENPDLYYCPSATRVFKTGHYAYDFYFKDIVRSMPPHKGSGWGAPNDNGKIRCRSSYSYWTWEKTSFLDLSTKPVVIDSLVKIPHLKRGNPFAVNALFGDGHTGTTVVSKTPEVLEYAEKSWGERSADYDGYVDILKLLQP